MRAIFSLLVGVCALLGTSTVALADSRFEVSSSTIIDDNRGYTVVTLPDNGLIDEARDKEFLKGLERTGLVDYRAIRFNEDPDAAGLEIMCYDNPNSRPSYIRRRMVEFGSIPLRVEIPNLALCKELVNLVGQRHGNSKTSVLVKFAGNDTTVQQIVYPETLEKTSENAGNINRLKRIQMIQKDLVKHSGKTGLKLRKADLALMRKIFSLEEAYHDAELAKNEELRHTTATLIEEFHREVPFSTVEISDAQAKVLNEKLKAAFLEQAAKIIDWKEIK